MYKNKETLYEKRTKKTPEDMVAPFDINIAKDGMTQ